MVEGKKDSTLASLNDRKWNQVKEGGERNSPNQASTDKIIFSIFLIKNG